MQAQKNCTQAGKVMYVPLCLTSTIPFPCCLGLPIVFQVTAQVWRQTGAWTRASITPLHTTVADSESQQKMTRLLLIRNMKHSLWESHNQIHSRNARFLLRRQKERESSKLLPWLIKYAFYTRIRFCDRLPL